MGKRDSYAMVPDDDEQFCRFWNAYPHRVAKKDARKAWAELKPDMATVDRMIVTLAWQVPDWASKADWYTPPYPASWLRAERYKDEAPAKAIRMMSDAAATVFVTLGIKP